MFHELRLSMEALAYSPKCPGFAKNIIYKVNFLTFGSIEMYILKDNFLLKMASKLTYFD